MLNPTEETLILKAARALQATGAESNLTISRALIDLVLATSQAREAMQIKAAERGKTKGQSGRPPAFYYVVEMDPLWSLTVPGISAAYDLVKETLEEHGSRFIPKRGSLTTQISLNGEWSKLVDTNDGTYALTVRKGVAIPKD